MKIILTGATGFVGNEILEQCLANRYITTIIVLTRKPLAEKYLSQPSKVVQILHQDFSSYPDSLIAQLKSAGLGPRAHDPPSADNDNNKDDDNDNNDSSNNNDSPLSNTNAHHDPLPIAGCIWSLGGPVKSFSSLQEAQRVGIHFPIQAAEAFAAELAPALIPTSSSSAPAPPPPLPPGHKTRSVASGSPAPKFPFRFVLISGWGAEHDLFRTLWMYADSRKIKGAAEKGVFDVAEESLDVEYPFQTSGSSAPSPPSPPSEGAAVARTRGNGKTKKPRMRKVFEAVALRPGGVLPKGGNALRTTITEAVVPSCSVDKLARCAVKMVLDGPVVEGTKIVENGDILGDEWGMVNSINK